MCIVLPKEANNNINKWAHPMVNLQVSSKGIWTGNEMA